MRCLAVGAAVVLSLVALNANGFAAQRSPIPITECGDIKRPGNYVLENDLVLVAGEASFGTETCLTVSASRVKINLGGNTITVACLAPLPSECLPELGVAGGIGIEIASGAKRVSISNGSVEGYVYGVVATDARKLSAAKLALTVEVGVVLDHVSHSTIEGITYRGADTRYHGISGPILYVNGGSHNSFTNLSGETGTDLGVVDAVQIIDSRFNSIARLDVGNTSSCSGADILLAGDSSFNLVVDNTLTNLCGSGVEVDTGGRFNLITGNIVTTESPPYVFAMLDENPDCGSDLWFKNTFSNEFDPAASSASPESCIH